LKQTHNDLKAQVLTKADDSYQHSGQNVMSITALQSAPSRESMMALCD
jgi:hypothetical protein